MKLLHKIGAFLLGAYLLLFGFDIISIPLSMYAIYKTVVAPMKEEDTEDRFNKNPFIF